MSCFGGDDHEGADLCRATPARRPRCQLHGGTGNDVLSGSLGGNDTIMATGGSEGGGTLSGVEKIDGAGTHNILLVGNGGYATIQAAVNAAADGDTIEIAAGTYTEDVAVTGKALTIDGVENGSVNSVTLNGQVTVAGTLNGAFAITDLISMPPARTMASLSRPIPLDLPAR